MNVIEIEEWAASNEIKALKMQVEIQKEARRKAEWIAHAWQTKASDLARVMEEIKQNETLWNLQIRDRAKGALARYYEMKYGAAAPAHPQHNDQDHQSQPK